ncbi:MAG: hypothetical protein JNL67_13625 [Planctomycetaceae bacterium]|nr:hypothetical protein [Planctomycetaceae bacterium]
MLRSYILLTLLQFNGLICDEGVFAKALWFIHEYGNTVGSLAESDSTIKNTLARALTSDQILSPDEVQNLLGPEGLQRFADRERAMDAARLTAELERIVPASRQRLYPELRSHAALLTTSFDMIEARHHASMKELSNWIAANWSPDSELQIISTCTGNSRRSIMGAQLGNLAAAYYGLDNVRFFSGGTQPTAFNARTIATLKEIGFRVEPTGAEELRSLPQLPNPIYRVAWGEGLEMLEFSKKYNASSNPQSGFAVILVCSDADESCPTVPGASLRLPLKFLDPKSYDDSPFESQKYAERRDDIARTLLAVMADARRSLVAKKQLANTRPLSD